MPPLPKDEANGVAKLWDVVGRGGACSSRNIGSPQTPPLHDKETVRLAFPLRGRGIVFRLRNTCGLRCPEDRDYILRKPSVFTGGETPPLRICVTIVCPQKPFVTPHPPRSQTRNVSAGTLPLKGKAKNTPHLYHQNERLHW